MSNWYQNLDFKLIRKHVRLNINISWILVAAKKTLGSFKKYVHSKPLIFDPPLSIPVHFTYNSLPPQLLALVSYPTPSQKKFKGAHENRGVKREKIIACFKLNIKDDNIFYTDVYTMTIKIFTSHKKNLTKCLCPFNKESLSNCQATYQKELYLLFRKLGNFFHRVNIEIGLSPLPLFIFFFTLLRAQLHSHFHSTDGRSS